MATLFAAHLVHSGRVRAEDLDRASERQRAQKPLIGKVALTDRILSVRDVMAVLDEQTVRPGQFGQVAIRLGLLTEPQLNGLLERQRLLTPRLTDTLVELGILTREELVREIGTFRALMREAERDLAA